MRRFWNPLWKSFFCSGCCILMAASTSSLHAQQNQNYDSQRQQSYDNQGSSSNQRQNDNQSRDQSGQQNYEQSGQYRSNNPSDSNFGDQRNQGFGQGQGQGQGQQSGSQNYSQQSGQQGYQQQQQQSGGQGWNNQRRQDQPAGLGVSISESNRQGVSVEQVHPDSPAQQAGIRTGDQIVRVSGREIRSVPDLLNTIQNMEPGQRVQVEVIRDGREQTLTATLDTRREALSPEMQNSGWQQFPQTPWGADDIAQHIQSLEQEIRFLTQEVQSLRSMIASDPDQFRDSSQFRDSQRQGSSLQNQRMSQRSSTNRPYDGFDNRDNRFDNSGNQSQSQGSNQPLDSPTYSPQGNRN